MTRVTALVAVLALGTACSSRDAERADTSTASALGDSAAAAQPASPSGSAASGGLLDPNTATAADLAAIPGLNDSIANAIVAGRPHANMVAVNRLLPRSLTDRQRDTIYARVWRRIDLNRATDEEILLIPGVGSRMLHEFKEYRPYTSIAQFRREIGKYVDDAELARLERYVASP